LADAARLFSYGSRTGIDLPGEISGSIPNDLDVNQTNLYAMAIGQGSFVVTPLQTSVMLSTLANGGDVLKPKIIKLSVGGRPASDRQQFEYQESLSFLGLDFPLFSLKSARDQESAVFEAPVEIVRQIDMPPAVRDLIFKGMRQVVQIVEPSAFAFYYDGDAEAIEYYKKIRPFMIGKTSSSESMEQWNLSRNEGVKKTTHGWFGCIAFDENDDPELVVVVYLRYAGRGKDAIPLAAQIIEKWRQVKASHE
jgi:cell division protein FtsI/penicillin-binding protein 2